MKDPDYSMECRGDYSLTQVAFLARALFPSMPIAPATKRMKEEMESNIVVDTLEKVTTIAEELVLLGTGCSVVIGLNEYDESGKLWSWSYLKTIS